MHPWLSVWIFGWISCNGRCVFNPNAAVSNFHSALNSGAVKNVTNLRSSTRVINVAWCDWTWNAQRTTHICAYTSLGGLQPSKWKFPFLPKSINDGGTSRNDDRTLTVNAKVRSSRVLLRTTDFLIHAADERVGAVQMLRLKSMA